MSRSQPRSRVRVKAGIVDSGGQQGGVYVRVKAGIVDWVRPAALTEPPGLRACRPAEGNGQHGMYAGADAIGILSWGTVFVQGYSIMVILG